jgi:hypothetical protein
MLKIGNHLRVRNAIYDQLYDTIIINITTKFYVCKKIRTSIDNSKEFYYISASSDNNPFKDTIAIKEFIDTSNKTNINYDYKKIHYGENIYSDIYDVNTIRIPIK